MITDIQPVGHVPGFSLDLRLILDDCSAVARAFQNDYIYFKQGAEELLVKSDVFLGLLWPARNFHPLSNALAVLEEDIERIQSGSGTPCEACIADTFSLYSFLVSMQEWFESPRWEDLNAADYDDE